MPEYIGKLENGVRVFEYGNPDCQHDIDSGPWAVFVPETNSYWVEGIHFPKWGEDSEWTQRILRHVKYTVSTSVCPKCGKVLTLGDMMGNSFWEI